MDSSVEIVVLEDLLPAIIARFPGAVDAVLSAGAQNIAEFAAANHPWQNRTGQTEASIHSEQTADHEFSAIAGGASIYLEWGTIHMPPFPFMQPAFDAVYPSIESGLSSLESYLV